MEFTMEENRIFLSDESGNLLAEVTFPGGEIVTIDHTFVDESLRGQGIAGKLMKAVAKQLCDSGRKARLGCSYAVSWFTKHPEFSRLLCE